MKREWEPFGCSGNVLICSFRAHTFCVCVFLFKSPAHNMTATLRKRMRFVRHEKGWMRRKRLKMERRYSRLQEGVEELKAYIKFKQDYRP